MKFSLFAHMERLTVDQEHTVLHEQFIKQLKQLYQTTGHPLIWNQKQLDKQLETNNWTPINSMDNKKTTHQIK